VKYLYYIYVEKVQWKKVYHITELEQKLQVATRSLNVVESNLLRNVEVDTLQNNLKELY
jgi:hypothetical protein